MGERVFSPLYAGSPKRNPSWLTCRSKYTDRHRLRDPMLALSGRRLYRRQGGDGRNAALGTLLLASLYCRTSLTSDNPRALVRDDQPRPAKMVFDSDRRRFGFFHFAGP